MGCVVTDQRQHLQWKGSHIVTARFENIASDQASLRNSHRLAAIDGTEGSPNSKR